MSKNAQELIVIKKVKKVAGGHHGGSWKIAFADFVTAMMAFFLVMWLISSVNHAKLEGIADYFKQPLKLALLGGPSVGERSVSLSGGGQDLQKRDGQVNKDMPKTAGRDLDVKTGRKNSEDQQKDKDAKPALKEQPKDAKDAKDAKQAAVKAAKEQELEQMKQMKADIQKSIDSNQQLQPYKDQIQLEMTPEGLRVQVIDKENRPMFATGSDNLEPHTKEILAEVAKVLSHQPNHISIVGHTDAAPYQNSSMSNWELSTQRANSARRELIAAGFPEDKVMRVTGYSSSVLFNKKDPLDPANRRISIIVMKKETEEEILKNN